MKRTIFATAIVFCLTFLVTSGFASNVPATQIAVTNLWTNLGSSPLGSLTAVPGAVAPGSFTLPSLHPVSGHYTTEVFKQSNGFLVFAYQVSVNPAASKKNPTGNPLNGDVQKISTGDWADNILVDAKQWSDGGTVASSGINRLGGVITMYFQSPLLKDGQTSYLLLLYTNATKYTADTIGIQDGSGTTVAGFVPLATPEPATLSLLGFGLAGLGTLRKKLRK